MRTVVLTLAGLAAVGSVACAPGRDEVVVGRHAGEAITCGDLRELAGQLPRSSQVKLAQLSAEERAPAVLEELVVQRELVAEARAKGVPERPEFVDNWRRRRERLLLAEIEQSFDRGPEISEEEIRAFFEANTDRFSKPELVATRFILKRLAPDASAEQIETALTELRRLRERHRAGEEFRDLARQESEAENAARGGTVKASPRGTLLAAYEEVAWSLDEGEVSEPFLLPDGAAIVLLERRYADATATLEQAAPGIVKRLARERREAARREALEAARQRWPPVVDWTAALAIDLDPEREIGHLAGQPLTLQELGLEHRPPRLRGRIEAEIDRRLLVLWAEETMIGEAERARMQRLYEKQLASTAGGERLDALLPDVDAAELEALYQERARPFGTRERRIFEAVVVPGEAGAMRPARQRATEIRAAWALGSAAPAGPRLEVWGPLTREQLSAETSPRLAGIAFELEVGELSEPLLLESYSAGAIRFQPEGYAVLALRAVLPEEWPELEEVRDVLRRYVARRDRAALATEVHRAVLEQSGAELDRAAASRCAIEVEPRVPAAVEESS